MRIPMPLGQFHRFADHNPHRYPPDTFFLYDFQGLFDIITIMDKSLRYHFRETFTEDPLTFSSRINDDLPEWAFFNVGTLEDARQKAAEKMAEEKGGAV